MYEIKEISLVELRDRLAQRIPNYLEVESMDVGCGFQIEIRVRVFRDNAYYYLNFHIPAIQIGSHLENENRFEDLIQYIERQLGKVSQVYEPSKKLKDAVDGIDTWDHHIDKLIIQISPFNLPKELLYYAIEGRYDIAQKLMKAIYHAKSNGYDLRV